MPNDESSKIRHLLPELQAAILKLSDMAYDVAKLEYYDNDDASRRVKLGLVNFENNEFKALKRSILGVREIVNKNKSQSKKQKQ